MIFSRSTKFGGATVIQPPWFVALFISTADGPKSKTHPAPRSVSATKFVFIIYHLRHLRREQRIETFIQLMNVPDRPWVDT
jgi:hypothetical protein